MLEIKPFEFLFLQLAKEINLLKIDTHDGCSCNSLIAA